MSLIDVALTESAHEFAYLDEMAALDKWGISEKNEHLALSLNG